MDNKLDIKTTNIIKAIALILMFASHLFTFPEWLANDNYYISIPICNSTFAYFLGKFGGICVCMFMFMTGYGMYFSYLKGNCIKRSLIKIVHFLLKYWLLLFAFFLPIQLVLGRTYFDSSKWHLELFGVYTSIVGFAWYVRFYVLCMLTLPIIKKIINKNIALSLFLSTVPFYVVFVLLRILSNYIIFHNALSVTEEYFRYMPVVLLGYCFAKFGLYDKISACIAKLCYIDNIALYLLGCIIIFIMRIKVSLQEIAYIPTMDLIYAPLFIFCIIEVINRIELKPLTCFLNVVGKNSMNLWFLQSIFFFETKALQWIVYLPVVSMVILIWNVVLLLPISIAYTKIFQIIQLYLSKMHITLKSAIKKYI